ncbi:uncharacterized protein LOC127239389 [Andrographis paniculata]|uniref:uncharacterized protein LOC127239389 n=1 Tax=Andrographis paniculata TaxID=175694 RepID=UPI0021E984B5|nr:uncharacterized protein LOC127239389 [Andrographis paniculata]
MGISRSQRPVGLLFFTIALAIVNVVYTSQVLKGSVACLDCAHGVDLSGFQVLVKCDSSKKLAMTYTRQDGTFDTELPSDGQNVSKSSNPDKCMAKIMGGPHQFYIRTNNAIIPVVKSIEFGHSTVSKPLGFYKNCPPKSKCDAKDFGFEASEVKKPLPGQGQGEGEVHDPSTYNYIPFFPIVGIP